jgi:hypothetical protein
LRDKLVEALKTYCVPPDEQTCDSYQARYQDNACYCGNPDYTQYNRDMRRCEVICPAGQKVVKVDVCPYAGFGAVVVKDF